MVIPLDRFTDSGRRRGLACERGDLAVRVEPAGEQTARNRQGAAQDTNHKTELIVDATALAEDT